MELSREAARRKQTWPVPPATEGEGTPQPMRQIRLALLEPEDEPRGGGICLLPWKYPPCVRTGQGTRGNPVVYGVSKPPKASDLY